jgi:hypothetical protein
MIENIQQGRLAPGKRACIALTSWKKRINTVGLTIFNLMCVCGPKYHIVLTLAEEEFPRKERDLPKNLIMMNKAGVFELLWCKRNVKSFKKILYTMQRYPTVPIISADDDSIYKFNYADELYRKWLKNKHSRICYWCSDILGNGSAINTSGYATLHPPFFYGDCLHLLTSKVVSMNEDDLFYAAYSMILHKNKVVCLNKSYFDVAIPHDEIEPLHDLYRTNKNPCRFSTMLYAVTSAIQLSQNHVVA